MKNLNKINLIFHKIITIVLIILLSNIFFTSQLKSDNLHLGFVAGLAVPNEKVSQFFTDSKEFLELDNIKYTGEYLLEKAASLGYTLSVKGKLALNENITFVPSIGISRFNEGNYKLEFPVMGDINASADVQSTTNAISISTGFNVYVIKSVVSPYINADLTYNYIVYSYDYVWKRNLSIPLTTSSSETNNRLGYALGAGIDFDLSLVIINLEAKWNALNIIKESDAEPTKNYLTLTLGIIF